MTDDDFDAIRERHRNSYNLSDAEKEFVAQPILDDEGVLIDEVMRLRRQINIMNAQSKDNE